MTTEEEVFTYSEAAREDVLDDMYRVFDTINQEITRLVTSESEDRGFDPYKLESLVRVASQQAVNFRYHADMPACFHPPAFSASDLVRLEIKAGIPKDLS